ncbi:DUF916 domain-containing protein [Cellulomonas sp. PS-H5]|uniref:COG1470 family protein n=1 Tax=Cellulomonas sp. PS-H5 TaxID=2820400 RepID=UPI001C4EB326|nr:DUF916 domain-containing protein [Cellulomonas sp. PS-H5]MBW0254856.1 DUF916 domain-containing protein [Cellulomonas sp. PS-H5]
MPRTSATPRPRKPAALAVALGLALLPALGPLAHGQAAAAASATTTERITWALEPATPEGPDGRVSYRHTLDPGAEVTEHVALTNFSEQPVVFEVYAGDGVLTSDGQFDLPPAGTAPAGAGSWVAMGDPGGALVEPGTVQHLEVVGGGTVTLPFVVRVPADATPGDHPAGIVAAVATSTADGVGVDSRVGARLHLRVTGDVVTALAVPEVTAAYVPSWNPFSAGTLRLEFPIANAGNVRLGGTVVTRVAGPFGLAEGGTEGPDPREVLPGASVPVTAEIPAWPLGRLAGEVTVTPVGVGADAHTGASVLIQVPFSAWALPWSQAAVVVLVAAAVVAAVLLHRRRADAARRRFDEAVAAARAPAGRPGVR